MGRIVVAIAVAAAVLVQPAGARAPTHTLAYATVTGVTASGRSTPVESGAPRPQLLAESSSGRYLAWEELGGKPTFKARIRVRNLATGHLAEAPLIGIPTAIDAGPRDSFVVTTVDGLTSVATTPSGKLQLTPLLVAGQPIPDVASVISDGRRLLIARPQAGASNLGGPCVIDQVLDGRLALLVPAHVQQNLCVKFVSLHAGRLLYTEGVGANHCSGGLHLERVSLAAPARGTALQFPPPPNRDFWMVPSVQVAVGAIVASLIPLPTAGCFAKNAPTTFAPELWRYTSKAGWAQIGQVRAWDVVAEPSGRLAVVAGLVHAPVGLGIPQLTGSGMLEEQTSAGRWRVVARRVYDVAD